VRGVDVLTDARTVRSGTTRTGDVCIVGGGAAGITLALELGGSGLEVILLESGGDTEDPATQNLAAGESIGNPSTSLDKSVRLDEMRLRYLGGTTNHWGGFCRPLSPIDFEERDHLAISGWPITHAELENYLERAAEWVRISDANFELSRWEQRLGLRAPDLSSSAVAPFVFQTTFPTKFGEIYRTDLEDAPDIEVLTYANVVNIATNDGRHIDGLDVRTLDGVALRAEATAYVLAAGGIENPRLLLASTDFEPSGVGNSNDLVGRHFTEHLQIYAGFGLLDGNPDSFEGLGGGEVTIESGRHAGTTHGAKFALGLTDDHVRDAATTGLEIQILAGAFPLAAPLQEDGVTMDDVADLLSHTGNSPATAVYLQGLAEQELDPESRVVLGGETDALGMQRVQLDWRYGARDRQRALDGLRLAAEAIGAAGLGRIQLVPGGVHADAIDNLVPGEFLSLYRSAPGEIDVDNFPVGMGFHHMCTTRMSASPSDGVVDANCRMHEIDNLWIGGSSVFATGGVATPTFSLVALAVRLADHLKSVLL
jgi:choline dehydrogenase-like flavoprotein